MSVGLAGAALSVKLGGAFTTSVTVVVRVRMRLTWVIVGVSCAVGVLGLVLTERVEDVVAGLGVKPPVAPLGRPLTLSVTEPVKPPVGLIVTDRKSVA